MHPRFLPRGNWPMSPFLVPLQQSRHLLGIIHTSLWHFSICTVICIVNTLMKPSHITEKNTCSSISLLIISAYFTPWKECSNPCTKEESGLQGDFRNREAVITIYQYCARKVKTFLEGAVAWSGNSARQQEPETAEEAKRVERTYGYTSSRHILQCWIFLWLHRQEHDTCMWKKSILTSPYMMSGGLFCTRADSIQRLVVSYV